MAASKSRLINDILSVVSTVIPTADVTKLNHRLDEVVANYDINRLSDEMLEMDLKDKIEEFIYSMRIEGLSENTLRDYKNELKLFQKSVDKPTVLITTSDIRAYLNQKDIMLSTVTKKLYVIRSFFAWAIREEYILKNPTLKIRTPKLPDRAPRFLSLVELEMLREGCLTLRERAIFEVLYSTGCRLGEIVGMKVKDVDMNEGMAKVIGKGNKERVVFLSERAKFHLKKYMKTRDDDCDYVFIAERGEPRGMSRATLHQIVKRIGLNSNLDRNVHAHQFRHSFAQIAIDNGMELSDLQQILGHSNPATSLVYARSSTHRKREAHRKYHV